METFVDHLARQAESCRDAPFLSEGERRVSFADFYRLVRRMAGCLAERGVGAGDRVVLYIDGRLDHLLGYCGAMALGAIPVHLYAQKPHDFVAFAAEHTAATLVLTDRLWPEDAPPTWTMPCPTARVPGVAALEADSPESAEPGAWSSERDPIAYMMFTSGTTGRPKAVATTQENVLFVTRNLIRMAEMERGDREVIVMPLGSTGGLGHFHANLLLGNHAHLLPYFFGAMDDGDMAHMLDTIEEHAVTGFLSTPGMLARLAGPFRDAFRRQGRSLRYILANVAPMRPELVRDLIELMPGVRFHTYYGLTEASRSVCQCFNDHPEHLASAGRPSPGMEVSLHEPDPHTGVGEVLLRGGNVMAGYWDPELRRPGAPPRDGWFHSGDLGSFDDQGFLTIRGRLKDWINVDGLKCFPFEVEEVLARHPGVLESAVVGVPDTVTFERLAAAVVPRPGVDASSLLRELEALCRQGLEPYKVPSRFACLDALPRLGLGKIDRQAIVEILSAVPRAEAFAVRT